MDKKAEKILVTGATGLIGTRLLPRLSQAGYECVALLREGRTISPDINTVKGDILDTGSLANALEGVTAIIHLAAVFRSQDTDLIWKTNLEGTQNLITAAKEFAPDARFIFASTSHVYNANNPHPGRETDSTNADHPYPASKIAAEKELMESGLNWTILRFPFVYGDQDGHLEILPKHVSAAKWHPAMKISTIHHIDIATAMELALEGAIDNRICNITDDAPLSIYELLQITGNAMESSSEPLQNPWYLHTDTTLARNLGFQPVIRTVHQAKEENLL
ncbi:MAG: epimerase [Flavobacterium psychrophilum]|nr:MAG: epimerase [Flavobacterium psychrophilum]